MKEVVFLLLCLPLLTVAQSPLRKGADAYFDKQIKTIQLRKLNSEMTDPVIELNSNERVLLSFDDLSDDTRHFTYKVVLCDADWNESDLFFSDYIEGFPDDYISDRQPSFNTLVGYMHYRLEVPNSQIQLKLSGNYLLKVYDSDNLQQPVFQKSFSVTERSSIGVKSFVRTTQMAGSDACTQQLEFSVEHAGFPIQQAYNEVKVRVEQNGFRFLLLPYPTPTFVRNNSIDYSDYNKNRYPGGSEYRHFDISSLEYKMLRVREIQVIDEKCHVRLEEDTPFKQYLFSNDINGRYVIRNERYRAESDIQSEYPYVHMSLYMPQPLSGKVYLFGEISNWELSNDFVMLYNTRRSAYELTLPVKQGYYNYKYVYVDERGKMDIGKIDYCSGQAENTYGIYVYYRGISDRHDRLMNVTFVNSMGNLEKAK